MSSLRRSPAITGLTVSLFVACLSACGHGSPSSDSSPSWYVQQSSLPHLNAIDKGWAVGDGAILWNFAEDGSWSEEGFELPFIPTLYGVWSAGSGIPAQEAWMVGEHGVALHYAADTGLFGNQVRTRTTSDLYAVFGFANGPTSNDVWAVGAGGTIQHWGGFDWSDVPSDTDSALRGLWGASETEVWAVGDQGTILRWDGSAWSRVSSGTKAQLLGVWGTGPADVWAVGSAGTILHWDGSSWSSVQSGVTTDLRAVSGDPQGVDARSVWAVGDNGTALRLDASTSHWTSVLTGTTEPLRGIRANGDGSTWAVGPGLIRFQASTWVGYSRPSGGASIWAAGASDVWIVSSQRLFHWDGQAVSKQALPQGVEEATAVWGAGSSVWLAGAGVGTHSFGVPWVMALWDGATWKQFVEQRSDLYPLGGLSNVAGSGDAVWAVGSEVNHDGPTFGFAIRWTGDAWASGPSTVQVLPPLQATWVAPSAEAWAVGDAGAILHWDGQTWAPSDSGTTVALHGVFGTRSDDVWAVGDEGALVHWNGTAWAVTPRITNRSLKAVWGSASDDVWAVGSSGTILHWNGKAWSAAKSGTLVDLLAISGSSRSDVWIAGGDNTLLRLRP